jgi:hypothetical protein
MATEILGVKLPTLPAAVTPLITGIKLQTLPVIKRPVLLTFAVELTVSEPLSPVADTLVNARV